jgi:hypothetical protein
MIDGEWNQNQKMNHGYINLPEEVYFKGLNPPEFLIPMDCFSVLVSHRIFSKRLDLLENFLRVYDSYNMYSISIELF